MKTPSSREATKLRDADFARRLQPRMVWPSQGEGTAIRTAEGYAHKPAVRVQKHRLTEAEDNAIGRAARRLQNRLARGWRPYAQR